MMYGIYGFPMGKSFTGSFPASKAFGAFPFSKGAFPFGKGAYPFGKGFGYPLTKGYSSAFVVPNTTVATTPFF